jgi:hypothetical protein
MTRALILLLAGAALGGGCAPGSPADRAYPSTHPASAEAQPTPFVRPANVLAAGAILPAAGHRSGPTGHAGTDHGDAMAHGGAGHAGEHGAAASRGVDAQGGAMPDMGHGSMEHDGSMPGMAHQ